MKRLLPKLCWAGLFALVLGAPLRAAAGGLYLTDRGSRQLGRGGAFVAGTDDGQSLWYNPAGLAFTGRHHLHVDGTLSLFRGSFKRVTRDDFNDPSPTVEADAAKIPIPTLAYSDSFGLPDWSFGAAVMAPNAVMLSWPENLGLDANGMAIPSPTRHSLISMEGSIIANLALGFAWHGVKGLSLGAGVHAIASRFRAGVYLSACDYGKLCKQPENPDWEAPAIFGAIYEWDIFRFGASVMLPYTIQGEAKLDVQLPNAPLFGSSDCGDLKSREERSDCAKVRGNKADVGLDFPLVMRLGAEVRPLDTLRLEAGIVIERWSTQRELSVDPKNIAIIDALGIDRYEVGPIAVKRDMQDVFSLRLGGEYAPVKDLPLVTRLGFIFENSAFADRTLTPLTLDSQKLLVGVGASYGVTEGMWVDVLYAHMFMKNLQVRDSDVYPQNPLRPPPEPAPAGDPQPNLGQPEPVGNGNYAMEADLIGLGLRWNI
jgi:long-chain fatty acid transport protein